MKKRKPGKIKRIKRWCPMYLIRLDDASEYMDIEKWGRVETILDRYSVKPIVGIIPNNKDEELIADYTYNEGFWDKAKEWQKKEWAIALHGYTHVYLTKSGGINPVNYRSEFAGVPLKEQKNKIRKGIQIFKEKGLVAKLFFAPSHTFDLNTLRALKEETDIRIVSDTIANDTYKWQDFYFIPQQSGKVRRLPFKLVTFCYHPNNMEEHDFLELDNFLSKYSERFITFQELKLNNRTLSLHDRILRRIYFALKYLRNFNRGRQHG